MFHLPRHRLAALVAGMGLALLPGYARGQTFSAQISPNPVRLMPGGPARPVTVSTTISGAFRGADLIAEQWDISRDDMEAFGVDSHELPGER